MKDTINWNKGNSYLAPLAGKPKHRATQCEHGANEGRYVVKHPKLGLCAFEPTTKLQALIWVDSASDKEKEARRSAVLWQCSVCGCTMPLGGGS